MVRLFFHALLQSRAIDGAPIRSARRFHGRNGQRESEKQMTLKYKDIVPWGRNFDEYRRMFDLSDHDLKRKIVGCGDGPASFNAECNGRGGDVTSIDPLYAFTKEEIQKRIEETRDEVLAQTRRHTEKFNWSAVRSVEDLGNIRMKAMNLFLDSYDEGKVNRRYIPGMLPDLPFGDKEFDLALCSHFLFLYTDNLSYEFHVEAIREMLRISREARIFPLTDMNSNRSPYVRGIESDFKDKEIEIRKVNYEFQIGGNEALIIHP